MPDEFILTNGINYIKEIDNQIGEYETTKFKGLATHFDYRHASQLLKGKSRKQKFIKRYHMEKVKSDVSEKESEKTIEKSPTSVKNDTSKNYKGKAGIYTGDASINVNEDVLNRIIDEAEDIMGLSGWDAVKLKEYEDKLNMWQSYYDSSISDIEHLVEQYTIDHDGKKLPANKSAIVGYTIGEVRQKRRNVKQCQNYIRIMQDAITFGYSLDTLKAELEKSKYKKYRGRTEYYDWLKEKLY